MENQENNEQRSDGVGSNGAKTSSEISLSYLLLGSCLSLGNTVRTDHSCDLNETTISTSCDGSSSSFGSSANAAIGATNPYQGRRTSSSNPYKNSHETLPAEVKCSNKPEISIYGSSSQKAPQGNEELKLSENIADFFSSPDEVRHLLFIGHENEHIAQKLLSPNIGSNVKSQEHQNENDTFHQSVPHPSELFDPTNCIYCFQKTDSDSTPTLRRKCCHFFHIRCYDLLQSGWVKSQNMQKDGCQFCLLAKRNPLSFAL